MFGAALKQVSVEQLFFLLLQSGRWPLVAYAAAGYAYLCGMLWGGKHRAGESGGYLADEHTYGTTRTALNKHNGHVRKDCSRSTTHKIRYSELGVSLSLSQTRTHGTFTLVITCLYQLTGRREDIQPPEYSPRTCADGGGL